MFGFDGLETPDAMPAAVPAGLLETHVQTQQKLEIMLRYWPVWCTIIAQARGLSFCVHCMWLIDGSPEPGCMRRAATPMGRSPGRQSRPFARPS